MSPAEMLVALLGVLASVIEVATAEGCLHARWNFEKLNLNNSTPVAAVENFRNLKPEAVAVLLNHTGNPEPAKFYSERFCVYMALLSGKDRPTGELLYNYAFGHPSKIPDIEAVDAIVTDMCEDENLSFNAGFMEVPYLDTVSGRLTEGRALFFCCQPKNCDQKPISVATIVRRVAAKRARHWSDVRKLTNAAFDKSIPRSRCYDVLGHRIPKVELKEAVPGCYTPLVYVDGQLNVTISTSHEEWKRAQILCDSLWKMSNYRKEQFCTPVASREETVTPAQLAVACCCFKNHEECSLRHSVRSSQQGCFKGSFQAHYSTGKSLKSYKNSRLDTHPENAGCKFVVSYDVANDTLHITHSAVRRGQKDYCDDKLHSDVNCQFQPGDSVLCPVNPSIGRNATITCCCRGSNCNLRYMHKWLEDFQRMKKSECARRSRQEFPLLDGKWSAGFCYRFFSATTQYELAVLPGVNAEVPVMLDEIHALCQHTLIRFYPHALETCDPAVDNTDQMRNGVPFLTCSIDVESTEEDLHTEMKYLARAKVYRCKRGVTSSKEVGISASFRNELNFKQGYCYTRIYTYEPRILEDVEVDTYFVEKGVADNEFHRRYPQCMGKPEEHCFVAGNHSVVCCCLANGNSACNDGFPRMAVNSLIESRLRTVNDELYECPSKQGEEQCVSPGCFAIRSDSMEILASGCVNPSTPMYATEEVISEDWRQMCKTYKQWNGCMIVYLPNDELKNLCCCDSPDTCEEFFLSEGRSIKHIGELKKS